MIDLLWKFIEWCFSWVTGKIISPLKIDVTNLYPQDLLNGSVGSLLIISPYPYRYFATLQLTNNQDLDTYVKEIKLIINETEYEAKEKMPILLKPHQFAEYNIIFPIAEDIQVVMSGKFRIEITPSVGRKAVTSGSFPLKN